MKKVYSFLLLLTLMGCATQQTRWTKDTQEVKDYMALKQQVLSETNTFDFQRRYQIYESINYMANWLLNSKLFVIVKEVKTANPELPNLQLVDRDGDGKPDEFIYLSRKGEKTADFGFVFDLNKDGKMDYIVFNGGLWFSNNFKKASWRNYHWIASNYNGKIDIFCYNDIDIDGDQSIDEGIIGCIYDRDLNGLIDEGEYLSKDTRKPMEKMDSVLIVKTVLGEKKWTVGKDSFTEIDKGLLEINSSLP